MSVSPVRLLLLAGVPLGLVLVVLSPPFQVPDEPFHFHRAWAISQGDLFAVEVGDSTGNVLPQSVPVSTDILVGRLPFRPELRADTKLILAELSRPLAPQVTAAVAFPGSAVYFPVVYFPQAAGIWMARGLGASPLWALYAGRLTNLAVALFVTALALRFLPIQRWVMVMLALSPMVAFTRSSLSADALTTAVAFLLFALVLRLVVMAGGVARPWRFVEVAAVAVVLGLCKLTYFLMSPLVLLIPTARFGSLRRRLLVSGGVILSSAVPALLWARHAAPLYRPNPEWRSADRQLQHLLAHPVEVALTWLKAPFHQAGAWLQSGVGNFGWLDTPLPRWVLVALLLILLVVVLLDRGPPAYALDWRQRGLSLVLAAAGAYAIIATLYLAWTAVGARTVDGVQGRYFLPLAPLLLLPAYRRTMGAAWHDVARSVAVPLGIAFAGGATVVALYARYFG